VSCRCVSIPGLCQDANHFSVEVGHNVDVSRIGVWSASITYRQTTAYSQTDRNTHRHPHTDTERHKQTHTDTHKHSQTDTDRHSHQLLVATWFRPVHHIQHVLLKAIPRGLPQTSALAHSLHHHHCTTSDPISVIFTLNKSKPPHSIPPQPFYGLFPGQPG